jgi:hypothetical protein
MANFNFGTSRHTNFNFYFGVAGIKQLVIKSTATPSYVINSINIENIAGNDVLYMNTVSGIVRVFSSTCSGIIDDRNIIDSDYVSGNCYAEIVWEGIGSKVIEVNTASGTYDEFLVSGTVSCLLYYRF